MVNNNDSYKGFNKNLTKDDLDKMERKYYDKLMEGISASSDDEKKEIAHLMDIILEMDTEDHTNCIRCGEPFDSVQYSDDIKDKKVYCNRCLEKMWTVEALKD